MIFRIWITYGYKYIKMNTRRKKKGANEFFSLKQNLYRFDDRNTHTKYEKEFNYETGI